jgi:hypothetical protein
MSMSPFLLILLIVVIVAARHCWARRSGASSQQTQLEDARAEAQRWYERLGGQVMNLHADDAAARQALADASERYNAPAASCSRPDRAAVRAGAESALEGWRTCGPPGPPWASTRAGAAAAGQRAGRRAAHPGARGGRAGPALQGRPPAGPGHAVLLPGRPHPGPAGAGRLVLDALVEDRAGCRRRVLGGMLIADALFSPAFGDYGYGDGYAGRLRRGNDFDGGVADNGSDLSGANDFGDSGGDWGGGDWGGGDFGGGDFGGDF